MGHEDWDFALSLAEQGIYGEPARRQDTLCIESAGLRAAIWWRPTSPFREIVAARHPKLYGRRAQIKARWNPALTLIALDSLPGDRAEPPRARECRIASDLPRLRADRLRRAGNLGRRSWAGDCGGFRARWRNLEHRPLAQGLEMARGRYVLAIYGSPVQLLETARLVEKTLRILRQTRA